LKKDLKIQKISLLKYTKEILKENKEPMMIEVKEEVEAEVGEIEGKEVKEGKGVKEIKEAIEVIEVEEVEEVVVEIKIKERKKNMLISKQANNQRIKKF
jgi:hypothetical protein